MVTWMMAVDDVMAVTPGSLSATDRAAIRLGALGAIEELLRGVVGNNTSRGDTTPEQFHADLVAKVMRLAVLLHAEARELTEKLPTLFEPGEPCAPAWRIRNEAVERARDRLMLVRDERLAFEALEVEHIGVVYEGLLRFLTCGRRRWNI